MVSGSRHPGIPGSWDPGIPHIVACGDAQQHITAHHHPVRPYHGGVQYPPTYCTAHCRAYVAHLHGLWQTVGGDTGVTRSWESWNPAIPRSRTPARWWYAGPPAHQQRGQREEHYTLSHSPAYPPRGHTAPQREYVEYVLLHIPVSEGRMDI